MIETLFVTTELGAERPVHRCGHPMAKVQVRRGKQQWQCGRVLCNEARRWYEQSEKRREGTARVNARRVFGGSGYLGVAPRADQAAQLNQLARDFRASQKEEA